MMIDEVLIRSLGVLDDEAERLISDAFGTDVADGEMEGLLETGAMQELGDDNIITGTIIGMAGDSVVVDVGLKSEGLIDKDEFEGEEIVNGKEIQVLLESLEDDQGLVRVSKRKADRIIN